MNKILLSAALAAFAVSPLLSQTARADDNNQLDNFYVAGNLGQSQYRADTGHDSGVFQNVRFGWRWNGYVGPEVGYVYLGRPKALADGEQNSLKPRAATIGINGKYDFYQNWFVTGHAGYVRSQSYMTDIAGSDSDRTKSWNNGWFAGAGVGYNLTQNVSVAVNYDNYRLLYGRRGDGQSHVNVAAFSGSIEYRF